MLIISAKLHSLDLKMSDELEIDLAFRRKVETTLRELALSDEGKYVTLSY